jgi:uncharacterized membrane protein YhhN
MNAILPRHATVAAKIALALGLLAGASYLFSLGADLSDWTNVLWKGAGVWLLAIYALLVARNNDGWLIALVMAMGALGDVLVEQTLELGAVAFAIGHVIAIVLYWRHRRTRLTATQKALGFALVPLVPLIAWFLTRDSLAVAYSLILGTMAACAWTSRFPRYWTGLGAILFVVSDLLIFANETVLAGAEWTGFAVWALYFVGQLLIVLGVTRTLANQRSGLQ